MPAFDTWLAMKTRLKLEQVTTKLEKAHQALDVSAVQLTARKDKFEMYEDEHKANQDAIEQIIETISFSRLITFYCFRL